MTRKEKLEKLRKDHYKYIKSLGVDIDLDTGKINNTFEGYDMPDLKCRPSLPTSDRIVGDTKNVYTPHKYLQAKQLVWRITKVHI